MEATGEGLQRTLNCVTLIYKRSGLKINTTKTQELIQLQHPRILSKMKVGGRGLEDVHQFIYLGSILADSCDLTEQIQRRVGLAEALYGRLAPRVFQDHKLSYTQKFLYIKPYVSLYCCMDVRPGYLAGGT